MTRHEYWYENDIDMINSAIEFSGMPKEVADAIFEKEYKKKVEPFKIF